MPNHKLDRETVAEIFLSGEGIEIGALHQPLKVPKAARVKYVDRMSVDDLRKQYPELSEEEFVKVDVIADGEKLTTVDDATQDFVIANHFIEHCQNPIGALLNMFRVLKHNGIVYLTIPDKRCCFDADRPVTPLAHILRDYTDGPDWSRRQHVEEWTRLVNKVREPDAIQSQADHIMNIDYSIHYHVWTPFEMLEWILALRGMVSFEIELCLRSDVEVLFILKKTAGGLPAETATVAESPESIESLPLPPADLIYRVHGTSDAESFLKVGKICKQDMEAALQKIGASLGSFQHILDFGCGSGRVLRWLSDAATSARLYATDFDADAIAWCSNHLDFAEVSLNGPLPPLGYPSEMFDLVYAVSVFSHLREDYQFLWLSELRRIMKSGGIALITIMGQHCINQASPEYVALIEELGFFFTPPLESLQEVFPEWYGGAYHTKRYVYDRYVKYFTILDYLPRGLNNHQDIVLLQKP